MSRWSGSLGLVCGVFCAVLLQGFSVRAEEDSSDAGGTFEERKARHLKHIEDRISALNAAKSCVQSAGDQKALRVCHDQMHEERREMRDTIRERRRELREKRGEKAK